MNTRDSVWNREILQQFVNKTRDDKYTNKTEDYRFENNVT